MTVSARPMGLGETVWLLSPSPRPSPPRPGRVPYLLDGFAVAAHSERPEEDDDTDAPCDGLQHVRRRGRLRYDACDVRTERKPTDGGRSHGDGLMRRETLKPSGMG